MLKNAWGAELLLEDLSMYVSLTWSDVKRLYTISKGAETKSQ